MSVIVKEMEMPENCYQCWFYDDKRCYLYSQGVPARYDYNPNTKPEWCKLVEIPTPHGRLIDKDELREKMIKEADNYIPYVQEGIRHGYHNCELLVDDALTVIESEE